eukprot:IDg17697t1
MEEQIAAGASRQSSRVSARPGRGHMEGGSFASLGSTMRGISRTPSAHEGPEWVDHAWDSLVRGRAIASDGPASFSDPSTMAPMSRLQMLAEDPFLEDLSLENLTLNHGSTRSVIDDAYSPPASITTTARGAKPRPTSPEVVHQSGPPSAASFYDSEASSAFSLTLDRGIDDRADDNGKTQTAPSSLSSTTTFRALRLEDILGRAEGVDVLAEKDVTAVPAVVAEDSDDSDAASIEWRSAPMHAIIENVENENSSSGSDSTGTMYTAPAEMLSTKTSKS